VEIFSNETHRQQQLYSFHLIISLENPLDVGITESYIQMQISFKSLAPHLELLILIEVFHNWCFICCVADQLYSFEEE